MTNINDLEQIISYEKKVFDFLNNEMSKLVEEEKEVREDESNL